jgi:acylphosphatase
MKNLKIEISGTISNDFLYYTFQFANLYHIAGRAYFENSKILTIHAEGEKTNLEHFLKYCKEGPLGSSVNSVKIDTGAIQHYEGFSIEPILFDGDKCTNRTFKDKSIFKDKNQKYQL